MKRVSTTFSRVMAAVSVVIIAAALVALGLYGHWILVLVIGYVTFVFALVIMAHTGFRPWVLLPEKVIVTPPNSQRMSREEQRRLEHDKTSLVPAFRDRKDINYVRFLKRGIYHAHRG